MKQTPTDVNVLQGQNAQIILDVDGLPRPTITWLFNGTPIQPSAKHKAEIKGNQVILNVNKTDFPDSGIYTAVIDNGIEKLEVPIKMNVGVKPKVEAPKPANEQSCVIGQDTSISWKFSGVDKPQVTWLFNGQPLSTNERYKITETEDGTSTLSIKNAELTDKGVYTAKATNAVGEVEAKTTLNIAGIKPVITNDLEAALPAVKGETMTIKLTASGTPRPEVVWVKGNDDLVPNDRVQVSTEGDDTYVLTIQNVQPEDQGDYSAKIVNVGGTLKSKKCKVTVTKSPVFLDKPTTQEVKQGDTAIFTTKVDGYPAPKVTWLLNGKPLTPKDGAQVEFNAQTGEAKLSIPKVDLQQHAGTVTCKLENAHGSQEETAQLNVLAAPLITTQLPKQEETVSGKDVTFKVVVRGSPRPTAQWFYNDAPVAPENTSYDEEKGEYQLTLKTPTVASSEGTYRVVLKNALGETESTPCVLTILEPVTLTKSAPAKDAVDLKVGEPFEISFDVGGKEVPKVQLTKDGKEVKFTSVEGTRHTFSVPEVKPEHQGVYKLTAKNKTSTEESTVALNVTAPLNITQSLTDTNVLLGQSGTLQIVCDAFPAPKVTWFFNDTELKNIPKHKIEAKQNVYSLTVNKCDHPDVGTYRVHIDNGIDQTDQSAKLNVGVKPKVEAPKPANEQSCVIGQDTSISWKFSGIEKPQVTWLFNGQPLPTNERYQITETEDGTSTLSIKNAELTDKGVYTAKATNAVGEVEAKTTLNIAGIKPLITSDLEATLSATKGESMTIKLTATGTPRPDVIWVKGNDDIVPNDHVQVSTEGDDTYVFTILNVQPEDQGDYSAKIVNVGGTLKSKKCKVTVTKSPVFLDKPTTQEVKQGDTAIFTTKVDGYPAPKVTWLLNGKPLTPKDGAQVEFNAQTGEAKLSIPKVDLQQHAGTVTCKLENAHGSQEETAQLNVLAAPLITTQLPKQEETVSGKDVTFKVVVRGSPRPTAQWFYNDAPVAPENTSYDEEKGEYQLTLKTPTVASSEGTYRVVLKNDLGETESTPCVLTILEPVKVTKSAPAQDVVDLKVGEPFEITMDIEGKEAPKVQLTKDGKEVKFTSVEGTKHTFSIPEVKPEHQGVYKLVAKNKTSTEETSVTLNVTAPLNITQSLTDTNVLLGQSGTLQIVCDAFPAPKVTWFFNDTELKNIPKHKIEAKQNVYSLTVNKCDHPDVGTYRVHVDNGIDQTDQTAKLYVGVKPKVEAPKPANDQSCVIGQDTSISWKFSGIEKPQVTWLFNGQPLPTNERYQITESEDGTSTLSIKNAQLADKGVYTAKATNAVGEAEAKTTLNIAGIKPIITNDLEGALQATKGESMTIKLTATGTPRPDVVWVKGNDDLVPSDRIQVSSEGDDTYVLTILNVQPEDQGDYSAKVVNVGGTLKSKKCKVTVAKSPVFIEKPTTQEVKQGDTAIFTTKVDGYPAPKVTWLLNGKPLTPKDGAQVEFNAQTSEAKLSIPKVDLQQHAGTVTCKLENAHGSQEETAQLNILAAPLITTQLPKQEETVSGKDVTLKVVVRGSPKPEAQWFHNDTPVAPENTSYDEEKGEYQLLLKTPTVATSEGTYRVVLKNDLGETESTPCVLTVLEPVKLTKIAPTVEIIDLKVGEPFEITADIEGKEAPKAQLTKDGKEIKFTTVEGPRHVYSLTEVKPEHQGVYKLSAKNKTSAEETTVTLNITAPLNISQSLTDINVLLGQSGTLQITCDAFPAPKVTWFFNDTELKNTTKHKVEAKQNVYSLTVNKCDHPDVGTYRVHVDNGIDQTDQTAKLNVGVKPKVEAPKPANDQTCVIGENTQISWKFSGIEKPQVTWLFNGQPLATNERYQITENEDGTSTLSIKNAELTDKGVYTAKATNAVGEAEAKTTLNIAGIKPIITNDLEAALTATKGESMTIKLTATGTPRPDVIWSRGNDELAPSDRIQLTTEGDDTYVLTILNVQPEDQGDYSAKVSNVGGSLKSKKCKVGVIKSPVFVDKPTTQEVKQGETATFTTKVDGYPTPKVTWQLNGKALTPKDGAQIEFNAPTGEAKLSIPKVDLQQHAGSVTCKLENAHGTQEEVIQLNVLAAPLITAQLPKQEETVTGKDVILKVVVRGSPRPEATWFYNDTPISNENATYNEEKGEYQLLVKEPTVTGNEGTYRVVFKNELGETESTPCVLTVLEPVKLTKIAPTSETVDLKVGEPFEITADIDGKEAPKVQLTKDGKEVKFTTVEGTRHVYSVAEVKPEHQGVYKLTAKNKTSSEETNVTLNITAPMNISQPLTDINVLLGQSGTLTLTCDAFPAPKVTWVFNDTELKNTPKHKIEAKQNVYTLTVNKCDHPDVGTYKALIDNGIDHTEQSALLKVGVKPKVEAPKPANEQSCVIGQDTTISWKFSGIEKPVVTWLFNGQPLATNERYQITENEDGTSTLSIKNAELTDKGVYTAKATNAVGEAEAKTTLNIAGIKPIITNDLEAALTATKGESMTIKLTATGTPRPDVIWSRGNDELAPSDRIQLTTEGDDTYVLTILNVQPEDQGDYSAKVSNVGGSLKSKKCKVGVIKSPVFVDKPTTQEVKQGETATFTTKVDGYPTPKVTWQLNGKALTPKDGAQIEFNAPTGEAKLSIPKVDLQQHAGSVTCKLENAHGTQEEIVQLNVLAAPLITSQLPKQEETVTGKDVTLKVVVKGSPRPEAQWFYNDAPIAPESTNYDEEKNEYQLLIKEATVTGNEGTYRVAFKNELGESESTPCVLTVLEPVKLTKVAPMSETIDLKVGEPFEIVADIEGKEAPKVQLTKDGKEVKFTTVEGPRHTFSLPEVKPENQGVYKLTAKNETSSEETTITLNITAPLNISQPLTDINVLLGQSGTLSLTCDAFPAPKVTWFFNDTELKNTTKHKSEAKQNVYTLTVNKCDHPDVGSYRAVVDNGIDRTEQTALLKVGVKPKVEAPKPANDQTCVIGQDTTISWKFSGIEKPVVTWLFNGQPLATNERYQITENEDGTSTLSIKNAELTDKGVYTAKATNAVGEAEAKTTLNIAGIKPIITNDLEAALTATKGESMTIKLTATGTPRPDVIWSRGNDELAPSDRIQLTTEGDDTYVLTILNVQPEDQGDYSAKVSNVGGSLKSKKCKVGVIKSPVFVDKPTTQEVKQGETATFTTKVDGYPTPKVTWQLNGKALTPKDGAQIEFNAPTGEAKLSIPKVDLQQHAGSVTCKLENAHGTQEEIVQLNVLAAPLITSQLPKQEETVTGKDVTLKVVVKGSPRPEAQWFYNDAPIAPESTSYDEEKNEYQLLIKEATVTGNEGTYRVVFKNELGETESTPCVLTVLEPVKLTKVAPTAETIDLKVGEPFEITADIEGKEAPKVQLTKDGKEVKFTTVEGTRHTFAVSEVKPEHQGVYKLTAKNKTSSEETTVTLNVTAPLNITQPLTDVNVLMGQSGTLSFVCDAFPAPKVTWLFNDTELKNTPKHKIEVKQNVYSLTVNKCDNSDIGVYRAQIDNGIDKGEQSAKLNVGTKPTVVGKPTDAQVQIGQSARLQVQFTGQPLPEITWSRADGQPFGENAKVANDENGLAVLVFDTTALTDKAAYIAKATNIVGSVEQKVNLDVKEIKPTIIRDLDAAINATKGEPMTLTIEATGNPKPTVRFFRGTEELVPTEGQIEVKESEDGQTFTATILSVQPNQQGEYTATAQNTGGIAKSKKCKVTVTKTATFIRVPQDLTVPDKAEAVFECEVDAFPAAKVTWLKDGKPLTVKEGVEIQAQTDKGLYTLRIPQADTTKHMGTITCRAENAIGNAEHPVQLNVTTAPTLKTQLKDLEVLRGQDAVFAIDIQGYPVPEITWSRVDKVLESIDETISFSDDRKQLTLRNVQIENEDEYNVHIKNEFGEITSKAKLSVLELPEIQPLLEDKTTQIRQQIEYSTVVTGRPLPEIQWLKNQKPLIASPPHIQIETTEEDVIKTILRIENTQSDDDGTYTLRVKNRAGQKESTSKLNVLAKMVFVKGFKDENVIQGQPISFQCQIEAIPKPKVTFYLNDQELKSAGKIKVESKGDVHTLSFSKVDLIDSGTIKAVADNGSDKEEISAKLNVCLKPSLVGKPTDAQVSIGQPARIQCAFTGLPMPELKWSRADGQPLNETIEIANDENQGIAALVFNATAMTDKGAYICKATNVVGSVEQKVNLDVKEIKPTIIRDLEAAINATKGEPMTLTIEATGNPKPTARFFRGVDEFVPTEGQIELKTSEDGQTFTLTILSMQPNQQGDYTATVQNTGGSAKSKKCKVTVSKTPTFIRTPQDLTVPDKAEAVFECEIDAYPNAKVSWIRDGKPLNTKDGVETQAQADKGLYTLRIPQADTTKHMGTITCRAENAIGNAEHPVQLNVTTAPTLKAQLKDLEVLRGQDATLSVDVQGFPVPEIVWTRGTEQIIEANDKYTFADDQHRQLIIRNIQITDEDEYNVRITNQFGEITSKAKLACLIPPSISPSTIDDSILQRGDEIEYQFEIEGRPQVDVSWLKNGKELKPTDNINYVFTSDKENNKESLKIVKADGDDQAKYTLQIKNKAGKAEVSVNVIVKASLQFTKTLTDVATVVGQPVTFATECFGLPKPTVVTWYFNDVEIKGSAKYKIDSKYPSITLTVNKTDLIDIGKYRVVITNGEQTIENEANLLVQTKPKLEGKPQDAQPIIEESARIQCKFSGSQPFTVTWLKNGEPLVLPNENIEVINESDTGIQALAFKRVEIEDKASYTVQVANMVGQAEGKMNLTPKEIKPTIITDLEGKTVQKSEPCELTIVAEGKPQPQCKWSFNNQDLTLIPGEIEAIVDETDKRIYRLRIISTQPKHIGEYSCTLVNGGGSVKSKKVKVTCEKSPQFASEFGKTVKVIQGDEARIECPIDAYPLPKFTWTRVSDNKTLSDKDANHSFAYDTDKNASILIIKQVNKIEHENEYICKAVNEFGSGEMRTKLVVLIRPYFIETLKDAQCLEFVEQYAIEYQAEAYPEANIQWTRNNEPIPSTSNEFRIEKNRLTILETKLEHSGTYAVKLSNEVGEIESSMQLTVNERPIEIAKPLVDTKAFEKDTTTFECVFTKPVERVQWLRNGVQLPDEPRFLRKGEPNQRYFQLEIHSLTLDDTAEYACVYDQTTQSKAQLTVDELPVDFEKPLSNQSLTEYDTLTLECTVTKPNKKVQWFFDNQLLEANDRCRFEIDEKVHRLIISNMSPNDEGNYDVVTESDRKSSAFVSVKEIPVEFIRPLADIEIQERSPELILECELNKSVHVEWYRFSTELTSFTDEQRIFIEHNDLIHRLIIKNLQIDDQGTYTCRYAHQNVDSSCKVRVTELPLAFVQNLNEQYAITENDDLILTIELNKVTPLKYEWLKDGNVLENNEHLKMSVHGEKYLLKVHDIKLDDQGKYAFRISEANLETQTNVQINELPVYFTRQLKDSSSIMENTREYQLDCEINKENKVAQWFKDDDKEPLKSNDEIQVKTIGRLHALVFNSVQLKHAGKYTCQFADEIKSIGALQIEGNF